MKSLLFQARSLRVWACQLFVFLLLGILPMGNLSFAQAVINSPSRAGGSPTLGGIVAIPTKPLDPVLNAICDWYARCPIQADNIDKKTCLAAFSKKATVEDHLGLNAEGNFNFDQLNELIKMEVLDLDRSVLPVCVQAWEQAACNIQFRPWSACGGDQEGPPLLSPHDAMWTIAVYGICPAYKAVYECPVPQGGDIGDLSTAPAPDACVPPITCIKTLMDTPIGAALGLPANYTAAMIADGLDDGNIEVTVDEPGLKDCYLKIKYKLYQTSPKSIQNFATIIGPKCGLENLPGPPHHPFKLK